MTSRGNSTRNGTERFAELDVARSIALLGIIVLNYHGYLNGANALGSAQSNWFLRLMDPWNGVLAPSPVIFVLVAGIGCGLLTLPAVESGDKELISATRWTLIRRGTFLFTIGTMFEWVWRGTILPYYGIYFILGAAIFALKPKRIAAIAIACTALAAGLALWRYFRDVGGHSTGWLQPFEPNTPRNLLLRIFVDYTHPVFPWFAFFCAGLIIGKSYLAFTAQRVRIIGFGVALLALVYGVSAVALHTTDGAWGTVLSTDPFARGVLATLGTCTSSIVIVAVISLVVERTTSSSIVEFLQRSGQITLTLYLLHGFIFNAVVNWWGWVTATGFNTALVFSLVVWVLLLTVGAWWQRFIGKGPVEIVYRKFGN